MEKSSPETSIDSKAFFEAQDPSSLGNPESLSAREKKAQAWAMSLKIMRSGAPDRAKEKEILKWLESAGAKPLASMQGFERPGASLLGAIAGGALGRKGEPFARAWARSVLLWAQEDGKAEKTEGKSAKSALFCALSHTAPKDLGPFFEIIQDASGLIQRKMVDEKGMNLALRACSSLREEQLALLPDVLIELRRAGEDWFFKEEAGKSALYYVNWLANHYGAGGAKNQTAKSAAIVKGLSRAAQMLLDAGMPAEWARPQPALDNYAKCPEIRGLLKSAQEAKDIERDLERQTASRAREKEKKRSGL